MSRLRYPAGHHRGARNPRLAGQPVHTVKFGRRRHRAVSPARRKVCAPSGLRGHGHLAEQGPVVLRDGHVDDPGRLGEVGWQRLLRVLEMVGLDMCGAGLIVAKGLDQDKLRRVVHASRPLEPQATWLGTSCPGELTSDLRPPVGVLGLYQELGGDEDHFGSLVRPALENHDPAGSPTILDE